MGVLLLCALLAISLVGLLSGDTPQPVKERRWLVDFTSEDYSPRVPNYTVVVDPRVSFGTWEGWGVSLCWWAHVLGDREKLADVVFSRNTINVRGLKVPGLGFNIVRYNLGGSSWRSHGNASMVPSPNIPAFKQVPGFWLDWNSHDPDSSSWDWTVDHKQRAMMEMARKRGADRFELFSNSPMWWMLKNHNPSGCDDSDVCDNLQRWNFKQFAEYLATTAARFKHEWGIAFTSVEPFNEPISTWWTASGKQEGCSFDREAQGQIIDLLADEMAERGLQDVPIAVSDENTYDEAVDTWSSLGESTKAKVGKVNVHGYQYANGRRDELYRATRGKTLWLSEYGDGSESGMEMANNLNLDFRWLHPTAWVYWQAVDQANGWGLLKAPLGGQGRHKIRQVNTKLYILAQYARHIRPGMTILESGPGHHAVAAYDQQRHTLVLVTANYGTAQWVTYDLSRFARATGPVTRWCTSAAVGGDKYAEYRDVSLAGTTLKVHFGENTVQTIEVQNALLEETVVI